jgi:protein TonB
MPPIEELDEPEEIFDGNDSQEEIDPGQYVPMQADMPSINTDATFVQKMDLTSLMPRPDFDSAKVASIPPKISRSRVSPGDMKDLFDLGDLDQVPTPLLQRPPTFPAQYKKTVPYAEVVVDFIVDKKGKVSWAKATSSTHHGFEDAAVLGVSRWQFKPGMKSGRAVNTRMRVPLHFRVTD